MDYETSSDESCCDFSLPEIEMQLLDIKAMGKLVKLYGKEMDGTSRIVYVFNHVRFMYIYTTSRDFIGMQKLVSQLQSANELDCVVCLWNLHFVRN